MERVLTIETRGGVKKVVKRLGEIMNSRSFCSMPCIGGRNIDIPEPGMTKPMDFKFHEDNDRALFIAMIGNTQGSLSPKGHRVAIVGLSPADTQLRQFTNKYNQSSSYENSALEAAFEGLAKDIARILNGLGVTKKLGLPPLPDNVDLNRCGHFLTTSLVKCASLTTKGSSSNFDPWKYRSNIKCITERFVPEVLSSQSLSYLLVLGSKAKKALTEKILIDGVSVHTYLERRGKTIAYIPHPSSANRESVDLASFDSNNFPTVQQYQDRMWAKYKKKQAESGKIIGDETSYKRTRASRWRAINEIRQIFS